MPEPEHQILSYGSNPSLWLNSLFFTLGSIACIIAIGYFLPKKKHKIIFTQFIGILLFFRFAFSHGHMLGMGHWNIANSLPLHLCGISSIACIFIMLFIKNDKNKYNQSIFEYLVLLGIPSGLHSILTPEFIHGWEGFYFYEFYISHGAIFLVPLYLSIVFDYKIRTDSWKTAFLNILMIVPIIGLINLLIDSNYMYLCKSPIADNPLLLTDQWPYYVPMIIFFVFLHNLSVFYIYKVIGRVRND